MFPEIASVSVPGRVCLGGESLDWMIRGPSVVGAIPLRTHVEVSPPADGRPTLRITSGSPLQMSREIPVDVLGVRSTHPLGHVQAAAHVFSQTTGRPVAAALRIQSSIPLNAGVSSSAAVTVAVIGALNAYWRTGLRVEEICALAFRVEDRELHTGAGQMDFYACGLGGILHLSCAREPPLITQCPQIPSDLRVVLVDTLTPHTTRTFLSSKRLRFLQGDPLIRSYIDHVEAAVEQMRELLGDVGAYIAQIGNLVTTCHTCLRDYLRCSTELLETCVTSCLAAGAHGAKLTGSGMGGCMFALAAEDRVPAIIHALEDLPVRTFVFPFSETGISVERASS